MLEERAPFILFNFYRQCGFSIQCHNIASCGFVGLGRTVVHCMSCHSNRGATGLENVNRKGDSLAVEAGEIK